MASLNPRRPPFRKMGQCRCRRWIFDTLDGICPVPRSGPSRGLYLLEEPEDIGSNIKLLKSTLGRPDTVMLTLTNRLKPPDGHPMLTTDVRTTVASTVP